MRSPRDANIGAVESSSASAEVLIVGAGPSGAVAAQRLAEAGVRVVCLEQGRWINRSEFVSDRPERELLASKDWHYSQNLRGWPEDYPCEASDAEIRPVMFNAVGGGTIHFGAEWTRALSDGQGAPS